MASVKCSAFRIYRSRYLNQLGQGRLFRHDSFTGFMQTLAASPTTELQSARSATVSGAARAVLLGGTGIAIGILWDISWHRTIGRDTFWTPAHMAIYLGGLLGGLTCGWLVIRMTFFATREEQAG